MLEQGRRGDSFQREGVSVVVNGCIGEGGVGKYGVINGTHDGDGGRLDNLSDGYR